MKNIGYGLAAVFGVVVSINNANAEAWGKLEKDSLCIEKKNIEKKNIKNEVISDDLFDEITKDELASIKKVENSKETKFNKNSKKPKSWEKSKKKR